MVYSQITKFRLRQGLSILAFCSLLLLFKSDCLAQRVYATATPSTSFFLNVTNPANAANSNENLAADLTTTIFGFNVDAWLQLNYTQNINSGATSFIRIEVPGRTAQEIIQLLNAVVITAEAYGNGTLVPSQFKLIQQNNNYLYLAITPSANYNAVRVNLFSGGNAYNMRVYYSFFNSGPDDCGNAWTTDFGSVTGTSIKAGSNVQNPLNAIHPDNAVFSRLNLDAGQKDVVVAQTIFFSGPSSGDVIHLRISLPFTINPQTSIQAEAYNGSTSAGPPQSLNFLAAQPVNTLADFYFTPTNAFDRVRINIQANSNANVVSAVNIYTAERIPAKPAFMQASFTTCAGQAFTLKVASPVPGMSYNWYNQDNVLLAGNSGPEYTGNLSAAGSHFIYVAATKGCPGIESQKEKATVNINAKPPTPVIQRIN